MSSIPKKNLVFIIVLFFCFYIRNAQVCEILHHGHNFFISRTLYLRHKSLLYIRILLAQMDYS